MKTYKERLIAGLQANGWKPDHTDRSRYAAFTNITVPGKKLFVGEAGALRSGACASHSYSIGDPQRPTALYVKFLEDGDKALPATRNQVKAVDEYHF